jgi:negative regulator of sigma E activity
MNILLATRPLRCANCRGQWLRDAGPRVTAAGSCLSNVWLLNPFREKVKLKPFPETGALPASPHGFQIIHRVLKNKHQAVSQDEY